MDPAIHGQRRGRHVPAALFRSGVHSEHERHARRDRVTIDLRARGVGVVLLDIEGTTTPIRFVHDVLFPYARIHLRTHLAGRLGSEDFAEIERLFAAEHESEFRHPQPTDAITGVPSIKSLPSWDLSSQRARVDSLVAYAEWLMDRDRKSTALKTLQGQIWDGGYRSGALAGEVFADVPGALKRWSADGIAVAIYSSGSVHAQRLLFGSTAHGDLTPMMRSFFDTTSGAKTEPDSYRRISSTLGCSPGAIAFFSDSVQELRAAKMAGMLPVLSVRPGNTPTADHDHFECVLSFDEVSA